MISGESFLDGLPLVQRTFEFAIITKEFRMSKMMREPTTPGEILKEEFLIPMGTTQGDLAFHLDCDVKVINRIVNGRSSVTAEMALKLAAALKTTPEFWLNAQKAVDLYRASKKLKTLPKPLKAS